MSCGHKWKVLDTTFYCVELSGHQCAHYYKILPSDVQRFAKRVRRAERELAKALYAADAVADSAYAAGMLLGWNLNEAGNHAEFNRLRGDRMRGAIRALRDAARAKVKP